MRSGAARSVHALPVTPPRSLSPPFQSARLLLPAATGDFDHIRRASQCHLASHGSPQPLPPACSCAASRQKAASPLLPSVVALPAPLSYRFLCLARGKGASHLSCPFLEYPPPHPPHPIPPPAQYQAAPAPQESPLRAIILHLTLHLAVRHVCCAQLGWPLGAPASSFLLWQLTRPCLLSECIAWLVVWWTMATAWVSEPWQWFVLLCSVSCAPLCAFPGPAGWVVAACCWAATA